MNIDRIPVTILNVFLWDRKMTLLNSILSDTMNKPAVGRAPKKTGVIYLSRSDLIPELHREKSTRKNLLQFVVIIIGLALMLFIGQNHKHHQAMNTANIPKNASMGIYIRCEKYKRGTCISTPFVILLINSICYEIQRYKFPNLIPKLSIRGCDGP